MSHHTDSARLIEAIGLLPPQERLDALLLLADEPELVEELFGCDRAATDRLAEPAGRILPTACLNKPDTKL